MSLTSTSSILSTTTSISSTPPTRDDLIIGDYVLLHRSPKNWIKAKISNIVNDTDGEWFNLTFIDPKTSKIILKQVQRYSKLIKPLFNKNLVKQPIYIISNSIQIIDIQNLNNSSNFNIKQGEKSLNNNMFTLMGYQPGYYHNDYQSDYLSNNSLENEETLMGYEYNGNDNELTIEGDNKIEYKKDINNNDNNIYKLPKLVIDRYINMETDKNIRKRCHWLIKNKIIVGGYPTNDKYINILINKMNINIFVNLINENELIKKKFNKYKITNSQKIIKCQINKGGILNKNELVKFIEKLIKLILVKNNIFYIHCMSGHGRTGMISVLLLMSLYGIDCKKSLELLRLYHKYRQKYNTYNYCRKSKYPMPQQDTQLNQCKILEKDMHKLYKTYIIK